MVHAPVDEMVRVAGKTTCVISRYHAPHLSSLDRNRHKGPPTQIYVYFTTLWHVLSRQTLAFDRAQVLEEAQCCEVVGVGIDGDIITDDLHALERDELVGGHRPDEVMRVPVTAATSRRTDTFRILFPWLRRFVYPVHVEGCGWS